LQNIGLFCGAILQQRPYTSFSIAPSACYSLYYGVATISSSLKNIGLFCGAILQQRPYTSFSIAPSACYSLYHGVATISSSLKNIGLFCGAILQQRPYTSFSIAPSYYLWIVCIQMCGNGLYRCVDMVYIDVWIWSI